MVSNNSQPLVSIVTSAYNEEDYIEHHIHSIISQNYNNIEHIVIDDGSTDNTADLLKKHRDEYNLRLFEEPNEGHPAAMNKGFDKVEGDIVFWLNADDVIFFSDIIKRVVGRFQQNPSADVIYGNRAYIDSGNQLVQFQMNFPSFDEYRLYWACFSAFNFMRRDVVDKYRLNTDYDYAPDYELYFLFASDDINIHHMNDILYCYRRHDDTLTGGEQDKQMAEGNQLRDRFQYLVSDKSDFERTLYNLYSIGTRSAYQVYGIKYLLDAVTDRREVAFPVEVNAPRALMNTISPKAESIF